MTTTPHTRVAREIEQLQCENATVKQQLAAARSALQAAHDKAPGWGIAVEQVLRGQYDV